MQTELRPLPRFKQGHTIGNNVHAESNLHIYNTNNIFALYVYLFDILVLTSVLHEIDWIKLTFKLEMI